MTRLQLVLAITAAAWVVCCIVIVALLREGDGVMTEASYLWPALTCDEELGSLRCTEPVNHQHGHVFRCSDAPQVNDSEWRHQ